MEAGVAEGSHFVKRGKPCAISADAADLAQGLLERGAQSNCTVLYRQAVSAYAARLQRWEYISAVW